MTDASQFDSPIVYVNPAFELGCISLSWDTVV